VICSESALFAVCARSRTRITMIKKNSFFAMTCAILVLICDFSPITCHQSSQGGRLLKHGTVLRNLPKVVEGGMAIV
jgi:hypothetical protein